MLQRLTKTLLGVPLGFCAAALLALTLALPAAAESLPFGQGLLWRVQRDGGSASYVLGTIHSTDARLRNLAPEIDRALDETNNAVFELRDNPEASQQMLQAVRLPPGRRLEDILGAELFQRAVKAVAPLGVPAEGLQAFKPWALSLFLIVPQIEMIRQAKGEPVFDSWLQAEARRRGKTIYGLETHDEQIEVFDGMSEAEQIAMVTDMLADHANIEAQFNRMFRAYLKGDIAAIMEESNDVSKVSDVASAEKFKQRLLGDRNQIMADRLQSLLSDGGAFIAIGAAHLPGDDGVLALLEQHGYRITRAY